MISTLYNLFKVKIEKYGGLIVPQKELENEFPAENAVSAVVQCEVEKIFFNKSIV